MKKALFFALMVAVVSWMGFAGILLGTYHPSWLPATFAALTLPATLSDFGQAFSAFEGFISSFALMLGLLAILIQVKQSADSNVIGAMSARLQFLIAEYERLDVQITKYIAKNGGGPNYDKGLVDNMINRRSACLDESKKVDERLKQLMSKL